jgi:hypothetical protein
MMWAFLLEEWVDVTVLGIKGLLPLVYLEGDTDVAPL